MNRRILIIALVAVGLAALNGCGNGIDSLPGTSNSGSGLSVQIVQAPPVVLGAGGTADVVANVLNDQKNSGVTWSCSPAGSCGTFTPTSTGYQITTIYTAPATLSSWTDITLTATSVTDNSQSASVTVAVAFGSPSALAGSFIFSDFGFTSAANGGEQGSAGGEFSADGNGNITSGVMDLNAFGTVSELSLAGSTYAFSGPRGTLAGPSGQTYNIYLTDPTLNLLDPNNSSGGGGALFLETDAANTTGVVISQTNSGATLTFGGDYGILLSDQSNPPNSDGGFTGELTINTAVPLSFSGEGDFEGTGTNNATPTVGPLDGTFAPDPSNPGRFTGSITTNPAFPTANNAPGTENVSLYLADSTKGVVEETDSIAPVFGFVESQSTPIVGTAMLQGQYAFVLEGYASFGMVGSLILDGQGNVTGGEADGSANGFYSTIPSITGTYTLDAHGHGNISLSLNNTSCCGTLQQTHGITAISATHLVMAEDDQFNGLTIGGVGSMDLQTSAPNFSASQVSGGYSFTLAGYSGALKANGSWGGVFSADGVGTISSGVFDTSVGAGLSTTDFTGTFSAPDSFGRGTLDLTNGASYAYYIVTPEVLRLTTINDTINPNTTGNAGNTGSAFGQGIFSTPTASAVGRADAQRKSADVRNLPTAKQPKSQLSRRSK